VRLRKAPVRSAGPLASRPHSSLTCHRHGLRAMQGAQVTNDDSTSGAGGDRTHDRRIMRMPYRVPDSPASAFVAALASALPQSTRSAAFPLPRSLPADPMTVHRGATSWLTPRTPAPSLRSLTVTEPPKSAATKVRDPLLIRCGSGAPSSQHGPMSMTCAYCSPRAAARSRSAWSRCSCAASSSARTSPVRLRLTLVAQLSELQMVQVLADQP
jgi:hypothetical protein